MRVAGASVSLSISQKGTEAKSVQCGPLGRPCSCPICAPIKPSCPNGLSLTSQFLILVLQFPSLDSYDLDSARMSQYWPFRLCRKPALQEPLWAHPRAESPSFLQPVLLPAPPRVPLKRLSQTGIPHPLWACRSASSQGRRHKREPQLLEPLLPWGWGPQSSHLVVIEEEKL